MKVGIIYMASGFGSRFGSNKLLEEWNGKPIYRYGLEALLQAAELLKKERGWQVRLSVVSQYEEIRKTAEKLGAEALPNPYSHEGITASIRLGTESMGADTGLLVYSTADQPRLEGNIVADFLYKFSETSFGIGCVSADGKKGNPAVFRSKYRKELMALTGDRGGSQIMKRYPEDVWRYPVAEEMLADVDVPEELKKLREEAQVERIMDSLKKQQVARQILEALPKWFGIAEARESYIKESADQIFLCAYYWEKSAGFLYLKETGKDTVELSVIGVLEEFHRKGIGRSMFLKAKKIAKEMGYSFMQVKTIQRGKYEQYDRTNEFYCAMGFKEFEVFPSLWDERNPCQVYVMSLY